LHSFFSKLLLSLFHSPKQGRFWDLSALSPDDGAYDSLTISTGVFPFIELLPPSVFQSQWSIFYGEGCVTSFLLFILNPTPSVVFSESSIDFLEPLLEMDAPFPRLPDGALWFRFPALNPPEVAPLEESQVLPLTKSLFFRPALFRGEGLGNLSSVPRRRSIGRKSWSPYRLPARNISLFSGAV